MTTAATERIDQVRENLREAIRATKPGHCPLCDGSIDPTTFEVIFRFPGRGWCHATCGNDWLALQDAGRKEAELAEPDEPAPTRTLTAAAYTRMHRAFADIARDRDIRFFDVRTAVTIDELGGEVTHEALYDAMAVSTDARRSTSALRQAGFAKSTPPDPTPGVTCRISLTALGLDLVEEWREVCDREEEPAELPMEDIAA